MAVLIGFGAKAQVEVNITTNSPTPCDPLGCRELLGTYPNIYETTGYTVSSIPYLPSFPTFGGTLIDNNSEDDVWSPEVNLPFSFNFYGTNYNTLLAGSNGVITFDLAQNPVGYCPWAFTASIPSPAIPKNSIFGVYQDVNFTSPPVTNPNVQNINYYILDTGQNAAPNRVFVVNFNELPQFSCNNSVGLQTSQIVLHEGTNIIEIFVNKRTPCTTWNSGSGLIGIQNATGTMALAPPGRNTGAWSANNEAWKFTPSGTQIPATITWSQNGVSFSDQNPVTICNEGSYMATVNYSNSITNLTVTDEIYLEPAPVAPSLQDPVDLLLCTNDVPPYVFNLTSNEPLVLNGFSPLDYTIRYYDNLADAQDATPANILNPSAYTVLNNQTIYMSVEDLTTTGCVFVKSFNIEINPIPEAPTGNAMQTFTPGETLANLEVSGENIQWYDQSTNGNLLPASTPLISNTTYYASQTLNGCSGRMSPGRLAVTATSVLGLQQFAASEIRLYPNPASNMLTVSYPQNISKIAIYNMLGQLVFAKNDDQKEIKLDISALTSGTYFIKIYSENADRIAKFVKK